METPTQEFEKRKHTVNPAPPGVFELRVMMSGSPDILIWRRTLDEIKRDRTRYTRLQGVSGFVVSQDRSRFDLFDRNGTYIGSTGRSDRHVTHQEADGSLDCDTMASMFLKNPYRLTDSFKSDGRAVNLEANHTTMLRDLLQIEKAELHMVGVSSGGFDVLYFDPTSAPAAAQDLFLDRMRDLREGQIVDWSVYDHEMLTAVRSYRKDDFCAWVAECAGGGMSGCEVRLRLATVSEKESYRMYLEATSVLLPHIVYFMGEDKGIPEKYSPDSTVELPQSIVRILS